MLLKGLAWRLLKLPNRFTEGGSLESRSGLDVERVGLLELFACAVS